MSKRRTANNENFSRSKIINAVYAFREARAMLTAYELGLFTIMERGEKSSEEIAHQAGTDSRATDRLLNALAASGYIDKREGRFSNTPLSSRYLVQGEPEYMGGLMHQADLWHTWSTLTDAVRAGSSVASRSPVNLRDHRWLESFIAAMHVRARHQAPEIVKLIDLTGVRRVLDVGGGSGIFSMAFVRSLEGLNSVVFDLPSVTELTRKYIESEKLSDRITVSAGDYTIDPLGTGFDLVFMSAVIHSNSVETNRRLFRKAFDALNPEGRLVVLDFVMSGDRVSPAAGAYFSLNMLVGTPEGDTFTESEIRGWMENAGFKDVGRIETEFGTDIMSARRT